MLVHAFHAVPLTVCAAPPALMSIAVATASEWVKGGNTSAANAPVNTSARAHRTCCFAIALATVGPPPVCKQGSQRTQACHVNVVTFRETFTAGGEFEEARPAKGAPNSHQLDEQEPA